MDITKSFDDLVHHNVLFSLIPNLPNPFAGFHFKLLADNEFHPVLSPLFGLLIPALFLLALIFVLYLISKFLPKILSLLYNLKQDYSILEIRPLQDTRLSAYSTQQLFNLLHGLVGLKSSGDKFFQRKKAYSLEIVSSKDQGIRYLLRVYSKDADLIRKKLIAYLPGTTIEETIDYFPENHQKIHGFYKSVELKLSKHFAYPLKKQEELEEHDPIAYITGNMTKLEAGELVALQLIVSPIDENSHKAIIKQRKQVNGWINSGYDLTEYLKTNNSFGILIIPRILIKIVVLVAMTALEFVLDMIKGFAFNQISPHSDTASVMLFSKPKYKIPNNPYHQELEKMVKGKIDSQLFEATLRLVVASDNKSNLNDRVRGLVSSFIQFNNNPHQMLVSGLRFSNFGVFNSDRINKLKFALLKHRLDFFSQTSTLSIPEISDIYHFPFTSTTKTEDLVKIHSKELPAPLSLKRTNNLDVVFAENHYGGTKTQIGLTEDERRRHMYILGATGTGKSTLLLSMINQDLQNGKGICVIDPHGELAESVLNLIPEGREDEVIYFNPVDIDHPIGLNLLQLSDDVTGSASLIEKEFVTESIISLFHKLYPDKYSGPRMEYILRNTIHTTFILPTRTFFTIFKILTNPKYMRSVIAGLTDENLKDFWKYEFSKAGDYQKVKMISPITNKIGRFLFSPMAKSILEQEHSSINFDEIMDQGKILICNLSKGKLGEDTSEMFGGLIMAKVQLAALRRAWVDSSSRRDFYLYVDEFQNFASPAFAQILSEARKYHLNTILAHQTVSQLEDKELVNVTLANTGTVICFRTANPKDEEMILPQFYPVVQRGEIANLQSFHFYIKMAAMEPQDAFSGETVPVQVLSNTQKVERIIRLSQEKYGLRKWQAENTSNITKAAARKKPKPKIGD